MTNYYLRMEGVNLSNVVHDTQDLSTIRGGGLMLLHAVKEAQKAEPALEEISTGASTGLFSFTATDDAAAKCVRDKIISHLDDHEQYRHCTFVVDIMAATDSFERDREALLAANRWRQIQSPSLAVPSRVDRCMAPCSTDLVRPQSPLEKRLGKDGERISESVFQRRTYGKLKKQGFYEEETGISALAGFVNDLGGLSSDTCQGNLHHKLAVIYLDGNGFGSLQTACKTPGDLKGFDTDIKGKRKDFLKELFQQKILKEPGWKTREGEIRLEILLWGGDEMILVVPAWKGWETLDFFYQQARNWSIDGNNLFHAGGLVFCHHKAHIHRITALAKELAELAKYDRSKNLFLSKTLESFDHIGDNAESFFNKSAKQVTGEADYKPFVLDGLNMQKIAENIVVLKRNEFPRSKIYQFLKELHAGKSSVAQETIDMTIKESNSQESVEASISLLNGEAMRWLHVAELWDYIPVEKPVAEQGGVQ
jgi:hypothetical protein